MSAWVSEMECNDYFLVHFKEGLEKHYLCDNKNVFFIIKRNRKE